MILKNLFKPRWQHRNPQIRRQALEELANNHEVLTQMACQDADPELRILALERLTDLVTIDRITRTDPDQMVKERAVRRGREILTGIAEGPSLTERLVWIGHIDDPLLLAYLARHGMESNLRVTALERISDDEVLAASAVADADNRVRILAASRLQNRTLLERVAKLAHNRDKGVHRIVQERLTAIIEAEERPRRQRLLRAELCADVEALVRRGCWHDVATSLGRIEDRWANAEGQADPDLAERFAVAVTIIRRGLAAAEERRQIEVRMTAALVPIRAEKDSLCLAMENLANDLDGRAQLDSGDVAATRSLLRTLENGWTQTSTLPAAEESRLNTRFQEANTRIRVRLGDLLRRIEQLDAGLALCERVEQVWVRHQAVDEDILKGWNREWQALGVYDDLEGNELAQRFQTVIQQLRERVRGEHERREQVYVRAEMAVMELEQSLEHGLLKTATPALAAAQIAVDVLPASTRTAVLKTRLAKGAAEVDQLQDWQRWGNLRERERLCSEVEAMVGTEESPERLATHIRKMRDAWNLLGSLEREATNLEERFNAACESAFEPCRIYFAEQARRRKATIKVCEALITQVEEFTSAADWATMDRQAADNFLQKMRDAWDKIGPVERRVSEPLRKRFIAALEPLQREIRREHRRNLKAKEELVARAEAAQQESDLRLAANEIKRIQIEWKALGYGPRQREHALWKKLRIAADDVFERRHAQALAQETERNATRITREALCAQLETLVQQIDLNGASVTVQNEFITVTQQWAAFTTTTREDATVLDNRFQKVVTAYHEAIASWRRRQAWAAIETLIARGILCAELEILAEKDDGDLTAAIEAARIRWNALGVECDPALIQRFEQICMRACLPVEQRRLPLDVDDVETLETLCIRLEVLAGVASPPESSRARLAYQVNRITAGIKQGQDLATSGQRYPQLMELLRTWYAHGPLPTDLRIGFDLRLEKVLAALRSGLNI